MSLHLAIMPTSTIPPTYIHTFYSAPEEVSQDRMGFLHVPTTAKETVFYQTYYYHREKSLFINLQHSATEGQIIRDALTGSRI